MTLIRRVHGRVSVGSRSCGELIAYIAAGAIERDERSELPYAAIAAVKRARLGAAAARRRRRGGATLRQLYEVFIELVAADPDVPHILRIYSGFVQPAPQHAPGGQALAGARRRGRPLRQCGHRGPSPGRKQRLRVHHHHHPHPDGLRLNGVKHYTTGNLYVEWLAVGATDPDGGEGAAHHPGRPARRAAAQRLGRLRAALHGSGTTSFDNVEVYPEDHFRTGIGPGRQQAALPVHVLPRPAERDDCWDPALSYPRRGRPGAW